MNQDFLSSLLYASTEVSEGDFVVVERKLLGECLWEVKQTFSGVTIYTRYSYARNAEASRGCNEGCQESFKESQPEDGFDCQRKG